jgi:uncharacterized protein YdhG (YjbR/CyaY superfamily)
MAALSIGQGTIMPSNPPLAETVDQYIDAFAPLARDRLLELRATIRRAAPEAEERISYRMPAAFQNGVLVYYAAFKKHIGLYPPVPDAALAKQLQRYAGPKGNLQFPLSEPLPLDLIEQVVKARLALNLGR